MSAILTKESIYGDEITFWRLKFISIDRDVSNPEITIRIAGYANEQAFLDGKQYKILKDYFLSGESLLPYVNNLESSQITVSQLFGMFYIQTVGQDPFFIGSVAV